MRKMKTVRNAVIAAAALCVASAAHVALGGDVNIGIRIGEPAPPPASVTVVTYDTYVVGYRRGLYDADWRLRGAQCDELTAGRELDAAQRHQGEIAIAMEGQEALVADLRRRVGGAAANAAEARIRLGALEKRIASARSDLDSARVLRDGPGIADAEKRLHDNEVAAAFAVEEIKRAEDAAEARGRLNAAEADLAHMRTDFEVAHDAVYASRTRLADAHDRVCVALHDRDESMWMLYRDDIVYGRIRPESVGFHVDLSAFGGRMPRDPELIHTHVVREVGFWRERPVEIQTRVVEVDRVTEVTRIREVQRTREGSRIREIETVETTYTPEQRIVVAERVTVERKRYEVERVERVSAAREGRKPQVSETDRAEAKAIVTKAQAEAKATEMKAHADAKSTEMQAHADAKATEMKAHADAKATKETAHADAKATEMTAHADAKSKEMTSHADAKATKETAHADAKSTEMQSHADAKSKEMTAHGDAKATKETAHADAKSTEMQSHADAKSKEMTSHGDAKSKETQARGDAKSKEIEARGDAKSKEIQARADAKPPKSPDSGSRDVKSSKDLRTVDSKPPTDPRDPRAARDDKSPKSKNGKKDPKDPRDPTLAGQASTDDAPRR